MGAAVRTGMARRNARPLTPAAPLAGNLGERGQETITLTQGTAQHDVTLRTGSSKGSTMDKDLNKFKFGQLNL